jgi:calcineurin-like phosphoesterase family protein
MYFDFKGCIDNVWVVSDTHYSHSNMVAGISNWEDPQNNCRPFNSIDEMNDAIVANINSKVKKGMTLIHLGDVAFGGYGKANEFLDRLECNDIIITSGNHDKFIKHSKVSYFGDYVETRVNKALVCMMHYPMYVWNEQHRGSVHLFGHVHAKVPGLGRSRDVGLDATNLQPLHLVTVVNELLQIPMVNNKKH